MWTKWYVLTFMYAYLYAKIKFIKRTIHAPCIAWDLNNYIHNNIVFIMYVVHITLRPRTTTSHKVMSYV